RVTFKLQSLSRNSCRVQRFDVADAVSPAYSCPTYHLRHMIGYHDPAEVNLVEGLHDFGHVHISVVYECLNKVGKWCAHIAKVNLPKLPLLGKVANGFNDVLPHSAAAFQPGTGAEAHPNVRAVGNLKSADISVEIAKDAARNSAQLRNRWIIR